MSDYICLLSTPTCGMFFGDSATTDLGHLNKETP